MCARPGGLWGTDCILELKKGTNAVDWNAEDSKRGAEGAGAYSRGVAGLWTPSRVWDLEWRLA